MRFGTTSASACTDRIAALAALNSCPPPSQFCVVRVSGWKVRRRLVARARGARDVVGARDGDGLGTHVAVRHQVRVGGDVGRARGGRDAPRVGSDGGRRARGETAAARERPPHGGERERRHGRHRASRSEMRVTRHVCEKGGKDSREIWSRVEKKKAKRLRGAHRGGSDVLDGGFFLDFASSVSAESHDTVASASARHSSTRASAQSSPHPPHAAKLTLRTHPASAARARDRHPRSHTLTSRSPSIGHRRRFVVPELHVEPRLDELTRADACRRRRARRAPRRAR